MMKPILGNFLPLSFEMPVRTSPQRYRRKRLWQCCEKYSAGGYASERPACETSATRPSFAPDARLHRKGMGKMRGTPGLFAHEGCEYRRFPISQVTCTSLQPECRKYIL